MSRHDQIGPMVAHFAWNLKDYSFIIDKNKGLNLYVILCGKIIDNNRHRS